MRQALLYLNTLRYLQLRQVTNRVWRKVRKRFFESGIFNRLLESSAHADLSAEPVEIPQPRYNSIQPKIDGTRFTFLERTIDLGEPLNWKPPGVEQLWLYNLHYFDYLEQVASESSKEGGQQSYEVFRDLVSSWMSACPPGTPVAWDPYPTSLRVINWIKAYSWFSSELRNDCEFAEALRRSLWIQTHALEGQLEYHLLGNHLIENGRALTMAGLFFRSVIGRRWLERGKAILCEQLEEQILPDGGHFERSPMYHQIMLSVYREMGELLATSDPPVAERMLAVVNSMESWLRDVLHPDGRIPLLNDAAFGIAPEPQQQIAIDGQTNGMVELRPSGYIVFRDKEAGNLLIFDAGPVGPDYQPGHGHCDTLSIEVSVAGQRFIVDSGVATYYGDTGKRHYYRSTAAHNTLKIDQAEQSEIWDCFRIGRRAKVTGSNAAASDGLACFAVAAHDGYQRLKGSPQHRRWVVWIEQRYWIIADEVSGTGTHIADSRLHLHPDVGLAARSPDKPAAGAFASRGESSITIAPWGYFGDENGGSEFAVEESTYASRFGYERQNSVIRHTVEAPAPMLLGYILAPGRLKSEIFVEKYDNETWRLRVRVVHDRYEVLLRPDRASVTRA
jgi:uncharacterized heparinase superfamily protein